jgi:hypothetical protein
MSMRTTVVSAITCPCRCSSPPDSALAFVLVSSIGAPV